MPTKRPSADTLIDLIRKYRGNVSAVARALGVHRMVVHRWIKAMPTARAALDDAREAMLDEAENVLYDKVLNGSTAELIFFLKTQGYRRGYIERRELTGRDGGPIVIDWDGDADGDSTD